MNIWNVPLVDLKGEGWSLSEYSGNVLLICNTASQCGFTKQYKGLQTLHERYSDQDSAYSLFHVINSVHKSH